MLNEKIGIALIGSGGMARRHAKILQALAKVELLGILSSDFARAQEFAKQFNVQSYRQLEDLLADKRVEIVDIVNMHCQHADYGIAAARAGKHVIVEKPMADSLAKAKELVLACKNNNVYLATIFQRRFDQTIKKLKKEIDQGKLGRIFLASARLAYFRNQEYYDSAGGWRGKKETAGGGVFINQAIHVIDSLIYLLGEVSSVYGEIETATHNIEVEDTGAALIRFKDNSLAAVLATTSAFKHLPETIEIHGTQGSALIAGETLTLITLNQAKIEKLKNKILSLLQKRLPYILQFNRRLKSGYHEESLKEIIEAIINKTSPPAAFEQGLKSLEVIEAIYSSNKNKKMELIAPAGQKIFLGDYFNKYSTEAKEKKPRVLLINPLNLTAGNIKFSHIGKHRLRPPLELAYISSFLKKIASTQLIDAAILNWDAAKTIEYINLIKPEILIISSSPLDRWQNPDLDISNIFNIINKSEAGVVVLTGAHGSVTPDWIFDNCKVDFVIRGEPELTCQELTKHFLENNDNFSQINGLSYKKNGRIFHNPDRIFNSNLDDYPFPDYESLPLHLYRYTTNDLPPPFCLMLTSRGCPGQCVFCLKKMMPGKYRTRTAENVYREIKYLAGNFGVKSIYFQDWEFLIDKERIKKLCDLLIAAPDFNVAWGCSARVNSLDSEIIALMKKAGCKLINFGYESGSQKILELSRKGVNLKDVKNIVKLCRQENINIRSFCLVNLPGENKKTLKESAEFIVQNDLNVPHINIPIPYPGTELAKKAGCDSWGKALNCTGKIDTKLDPYKAKKILKKYIRRKKFGKLYPLNPKFWFHISNVLKKKILS